MIVKQGLNVSSHLSSYFTDNPPTYGSQQRHRLDVELGVQDRKVRASAGDYDGLERPFALVPSETAQGVAWQRKDLTYQTTRAYSHGLEGQVVEDRFELSADGVDSAALRKYGFAIGMDVNGGRTFWAQAPGRNHHPKLG